MSAHRGFALLVSLVVLLALTLLAVSSINMTQVDMRIVGNTQAQQDAEDAVALYLEELLIDHANFIESSGTVGDIAYVIDCMEQRTQPGFSLTIQDPPPPEIAYWHTRAATTDPVTNAAVALNQGVRMVMLAENPACQ